MSTTQILQSSFFAEHYLFRFEKVESKHKKRVCWTTFKARIICDLNLLKTVSHGQNISITFSKLWVSSIKTC